MVASMNTAHHPASRSTRWSDLFGRARRRLSRIGSLLSNAGYADRPEFEHLEQRQLLFALTITPEMVNPVTGVGTIRAWFGYAIPYLAPTAEADDSDQEEIEEDFSGSDPGVPGTAAAVVPQVHTWQSGITVRHNLPIEPPALAGMILVEEPEPHEADNEVRVRIAGGQEFTFSVTEFNLGMELFEITFREGSFNGSSFTVELLRDDIVLTTLTGMALDELGTPGDFGVRYTFVPPPGNLTFDQIRFIANPGIPNITFTYDNIRAILPGRPFDSILEPRLHGVAVAFTGPVGATAEFFDLYDRPMRLTIAVGEPPNAPFPFLMIDRDGDGIPDFNDGIGRIVMSDVDGRSALTMWGTELGASVPPPADVDFVEDFVWWARLPNDLMGFFEDFQEAGFGYAARPDGATWDVSGLPQGMGSIVIGSPVHRPLDNYNVTGLAPEGVYEFSPVGVTVVGGFNNPNQGFFINDGSSMASVYAHAILHGSSRFTGYLDQMVIGPLMGSVSVKGDLGYMVVASDSGVWVDDEGVAAPNGAAAIRTGSQIVVGRTLGELIVVGRNLSALTVIGDLDSPDRPGRNVLRYHEREHQPLLGPGGDTRDAIREIMSMNNAFAWNIFFADTGILFERVRQPVFVGVAFGTNNTILTSEWVGNAGTAVEIHGAVGFRGAVQTAFDPSDVYGFSADGTQDIMVELNPQLPVLYMRIVDAYGRTVAATHAGHTARDTLSMRYRPDAPGVYFLVIQTQALPDGPAVASNYVARISGMTTNTLGAIRVGASAGNIPGTGLTNTVDVMGGSIGVIMTDTSFLSGEGALAEVEELINVAEEAMPVGLRGSTFSVPGNLYGILTGWGIDGMSPGGAPPVHFNVGGHIGMIYTGLHPELLADDEDPHGNIRGARFNVGGSIGSIHVRGGIGTNQGPEADRPWSTDPAQSVIIRTGLDPLLKGDIGYFWVGSHVGAETLTVRTSPGSTIGAFLVSQLRLDEVDEEDYGIYVIDGRAHGVDFQLGANSDLRFFDTPRMDLFEILDHTVAIPTGNQQPLMLTDDAGGRVSLQIVGGSPEASGTVRMLPLNHNLSQGVAIGRVTVNLEGGAALEIRSQGPGNNQHVVSIGRIEIVEADENSAIRITGPVQVDVYNITQAEGEGFNEIINTTPRGDLVSVDVVGLNRLEIGTGNLGVTQVPTWGPQRIGPFRGITSGTTSEVGGPLPLDAAAMSDRWNGGLFRPVNQSDFRRAPGPDSWLDDLGAPFDPYLNGLIVRTGDMASVEVGGAIGDVFVAGGILGNVIANANGQTPNGEFHGIVGNIHAERISRVDIGDGLAPRGPSPLARTGITATDDINIVVGSRIPGAHIQSNIIAANVNEDNADPALFPTDGIDQIQLSGGGSFIGAFIGATPLDDFWWAVLAPDDNGYTGTINQIRGTDANMIRTEVRAEFLNTLVLNRGFYDGSITHISQDAQRIEAAGFRNSTVGGGEMEHFPNRITVASDLGIVTTSGRQGDMNDLHVHVHRRLGEVSARNITRTQIDANNELANLIAVQDLRSSEITTGLLTRADIGQNVRSSRLMVSGPLVNLTVGDSLTNSQISVTGPDGRIDRITVTNLLSGLITSTGSIDTIRVTQGDMIATIRTTRSLHGNPSNINMLSAARDLNIRTDVAGTINQLVAGRHIGNRADPTIILVRGDIQSVSAPNGQLYSDLRVGGRVQDVRLGATVNLPANSEIGAGSIIAFGRIENITIEGDFGGDIISYSGGIGVITINNGSFLPGGRIAAYDGTLTNLFINSGNLYGDVHADYHILAIRLNGSADGVFGHVGINPNFSAGTPYSDTRHQHPPGVIAGPDIQGPRITAGHNLGRLILTNGSMFESFVYAGRAIGTIEVNGDIRNDPLTNDPEGTVIAAGSSIFTVRATGSVSDTIILAGIRDFGANQRPGGIGADADWVESGRIQTVDIHGNATRVKVSAGMDAGPDGVYNTGDELVALGISFVREVLVGGTVTDVSVFADSPTLSASPGIMLAGSDFVHRDVDIHPGGPVGTEIPADASTFGFTTSAGETGTVTFTGPGRAFWDAATDRIVLVNTSLNSQLHVTSDTFRLTDFGIVSNDNASMGSVRVDANLFGQSRIVVDAYVLNIETWDLHDESAIRVGMNVRNISTGSVHGGSIEAMFWARDIRVNGNFGTPADFDEARIDALAADTIRITGDNAALVNIERDLNAFVVDGSMTRAQFRAGASVNSFTTGAISESRVSVRNTLGPVRINGDLYDTVIQAGGDLGSNVLPGADNQTTTGHITSVRVEGNFERGSIVAGLLRGPDGFFGTEDDFAAPGLSTIGPVTITGTAMGSNTHSQQYRISATGSMGPVTINGQPGANQGNFQIRQLDTTPAPILVEDVQSFSEGLTWRTWIYFNQPMNESTIGPALTVSEVRRDAEGLLTQIPLTEGVDYRLTDFDPEHNRIGIIYDREVTSRPLDDETGQRSELPGPGIYRIQLDADVLRAEVVSARLAGERGGFGNSVRDFSQDTIVGDAGDKLESNIVHDSSGNRIDFYGPTDLNLVMDNNETPDGLPDPNLPYTVRGALGDHPAHIGSEFPSGADADVYRITLRAGQILRLGGMEGAARFAMRLLVNSDGEIQFGSTPSTLSLPADPFDLLNETIEQHYLIKQTGTYYIVVANHLDWDDPEVIPMVQPASGMVGNYRFTVEVFDDGKSGFSADTDSGNGELVVNAPHPIVFAGPSGVFGTEDDRHEVIIGDFVFRLTPGPDGDPMTGTVEGSNGRGIVSSRVGETLTTRIEAAIGPRGHAGVPSTTTPDVDIYHLNNRQPIAPGQLITITVKLADIGADLGSFAPGTFFDFRGDVEFAVFDTTHSVGIDDAVLVFSPKDFMPIAGEPNQIARQGDAMYGFDENGDFFISFITPGRIEGSASQGATYAVYLQGVFNTDYEMEIVQTDALQNLPLPRGRLNVLLETKGGSIDWLQAGGLTTELSGFTGSVLGFVGSLNQQSVDSYIINSVRQNLQSIFTAAGVDVNIATNASAFEFQDFSTVFLTSSNDPVMLFNSSNYGYSQRSDPFNLDRNDESVIFMPSFGSLGMSGSRVDIDNFVLSLTAAVGRRIGEMAGLRMTAPQGLADPRDIMSSNSVNAVRFFGGNYEFLDQARPLSTGFDSISDTGFFLGQQNSLALLQRYIRPL